MVFLAVKHGRIIFGDYPDRQQNVLELAIQYAKADVLLLAFFKLELCLQLSAEQMLRVLLVFVGCNRITRAPRRDAVFGRAVLNLLVSRMSGLISR